MKHRVLLVFLFGLAFAVLGCRGRAQLPVQATQPPAQPISATAPNVTITWPPNGARVRIGQPFTIHLTATDVTGIARVGYAVDGQTGAPLEASAQPIFSASFPVTLPSKGVHAITVVAVNRGGTKSEPAVIRVVGVNTLSDAPAADEPPTPVPQLPSAANPPPTSQPAPDQPAPPPPPSGASVSFVANPSSIQAGQCTTARWDVDGVREIYFEGAGVTGHEERELCNLSADTTFVLHVVFQDGSANDYTTSVSVAGSTPSGGQGQQGDAPPAPTNCRANEVTAHRLLMQWDYSGTAGGFNIYITRTRRVASADGQARAVPVENLNAGTRYHIEVRAFNAFGESPVNGCAADVTTASGEGPAFAITGATLQVNPVNFDGQCPKSIQFLGTITANGAGSTEIVWVQTAADPQASQPIPLTFERAESKNVTYGIQANRDGGFVARLDVFAPDASLLARSNDISFRVNCTNPPAQRPPPPTDCTASVTGAGKVLVRWTFPDVVQVGQVPDGFRIYQGVSSREADNIAPSHRNQAVSGLTPGVQYHFDVRAFNAAGESAADSCAVDINAQ